jgi:hypothetical protein
MEKALSRVAMLAMGVAGGASVSFLFFIFLPCTFQDVCYACGGGRLCEFFLDFFQFVLK